MHHLRQAIAAVLLSIIASYALAQSSCESVYNNSTRDIDSVSRQEAEYSEKYSQHCEINGSLRTSSSSQDLSGEYSGIKVGWKGTQAEALTGMQEFCKTQHDKYSQASSFISISNTVVIEALNSFNQCKLIEGKMLKMSHIANIQSVMIRGDFDPTATLVEVQSVRYDPDRGECRTTAIAPPKSLVVGNNTNAFRPKSTFIITCTRKGTTSADGNVEYPRFEVAVATNVGTYPVTLLGQNIESFDLASENRQLRERHVAVEGVLTEKIASLNKVATGLQTTLDGVVITAHREEVLLGCDKPFTLTCPAPSKLTGTPVFEDRRGLLCTRVWAYSCITIPGR